MFLTRPVTAIVLLISVAALVSVVLPGICRKREEIFEEDAA
ncbi:hypothetical protein ACLBWS_08355 [Brucellaceae bacterium D45D]